MTTTTAARALLAQFSSDLIAQFDAIDGTSPPPSGTPLPTARDCLAGVDPLWSVNNMYSDELYGDPDWSQQRVYHKAAMAAAPSGSIMLIGDSMLARHGNTIPIPHNVNLGISGESIRQCLYRLNETDSNSAPGLVHRAGALVVLTGINDASDSRNGSQANCAATVNYVMDKLVNWTTGAVVLICPIKVNSAVFSIPSNTDFVNAVSAHMLSAYTAKSHVRVIDLNPIVAPNNTLLPLYDSGDGQHGSVAFRDLLAEKVNEQLVSLGVFPS